LYSASTTVLPSALIFGSSENVLIGPTTFCAFPSAAYRLAVSRVNTIRVPAGSSDAP